jgi:hypothetical protein
VDVELEFIGFTSVSILNLLSVIWNPNPNLPAQEPIFFPNSPIGWPETKQTLYSSLMVYSDRFVGDPSAK